MRLYCVKRLRRFVCQSIGLSILCFVFMCMWHLRHIVEYTQSLQLPNTEVRHIVFLKVHKAASSTVQNIFLRFGYKRNLTFVLGRSTNFYPQVISFTDSVTNDNTRPPPPNRSFDILCSHVIYNRSVFESIMSYDTVYIGIVREPYSQFVSALHYFRPKYIFDIPGPDPISVYIKNPYSYEPLVKYSLSNNRQAFEFGFPLNLFDTKHESEIRKYLNTLSQEFTLVLIAEFLSESIVLMKRYLKWEFRDVLYLTKNTWAELSKELRESLDKNFHVNQTTENWYKSWAKLDYMLYEFFKEKLTHQIQAEGPDFLSEVSYFKTIRKRIENFCVHEARPFRSVFLTIAKSQWNDPFVITNTDCSQMLLPERDFHQEIQLQQYGP